jgi:anti-sigma regulatory factor (Ser/Thr protein kinase)
MDLRYPKLQTIAFSNVLLELCHQARTSTEDTIHFDLSKTEFITPFGIILLSGTISECLAQGKETIYRRPEKVKTKKFLSGIGFNNFFKITGDDHNIESPNVQLKRIYNIDYLLTDKILEVFSASIHMSDGVQGSLKMALNELMTNAFDHSESARGCYVCAQTYKQAKTIRLCIADFGIGILASLKKVEPYGELTQDDEAIKLSVKEGVTSRIGRVAGYGLTHINRFIDVNKGIMHIISGNGKVNWNYTGVKKRKNENQTMHYPFQGTIINLTINADQEGYYFLTADDGEIF